MDTAVTAAGRGLVSVILDAMATLGPPRRGATVPVVVDAIRDVPVGSPSDLLSMARVSYFVVSSEVTAGAWVARARLTTRVGLVQMGPVAVITRPGVLRRRFVTPALIERTIERIERDDQLLVEMEDVHLPVALLADEGTGPDVAVGDTGRAERAGTTSGAVERGDVRRIPLPVLELAVRFRETEIELPEYLDELRRTAPDVVGRRSPAEATGIERWFDSEVEHVRATQDETKKLERRPPPWSDGTDGPRVGS